MNQLNVNLCFVLIFSRLLGVVRCTTDKNILNRVLNYSFKGYSCVQLFSLDDFPSEYYQVLPQLGIPVMINQSHKYCYGFVLFATDTINLKKMLLNIKKYYNHRIVCYLKYEDSGFNYFIKASHLSLLFNSYRNFLDAHDKLIYFTNAQVIKCFQNEPYFFGDSEALVTNGRYTYKLDKLEKRFYEINLIGEEETWGKQVRKIIMVNLMYLF